MKERTAPDYAIEFGEYLAKAAERYLAARDRLLMLQGEDELAPDPATLAAAEESESDHASGVRGAVYEFRKRAERAKATLPEALAPKMMAEVQDAAYAFRDSLVPRADHHSGGGRYPMWHGWAIYDAFIAGADFARRSPPRRVVNQCDGCQRGLPTRKSTHGTLMHDDFAGIPLMACTADRYEDPLPQNGGS